MSRVLPIAEKWPKLHLERPADKRPPFTTFRFPRKDADRGRDWAKGEIVQLVYRCRSKVGREVLGQAVIVEKASMNIGDIGHHEAVADGFPGGRKEMFAWLAKAHHSNLTHLKMRPINKLTLRWEKS